MSDTELSDAAVWVYGVGRSGLRISDMTGVSGERLRLVTNDDLTAVVGSVSRDEYGEDGLRRNLEDLAWLDTRARLHHRVISSVAESGPVVPMRLAVIYDNDERVRQMLVEAHDEINATLAVLTGRSEWGVKVFVSSSGEPGRQSGSSPGSDTPGQKVGTAYLQRKRADLKAREEARQSHAATAQTIYAAFRKVAVAARRHALQDPQLSGESRDMLLNAAYLVEDERSEEFAAAVMSFRKSLDGFDIQLTGPWPPYSFTSAAGPS